MSKKLEELFDLAPATEEENISSADTPDIDEQKKILQTADEAIDKIDVALPTVRDLETSDSELDVLSDLAKTTFDDLISLSMNVEPRYSGPIIQSASTLLGHAITAKVAKMDKKLKMVDLQLRKANLDLKAADLKRKEKAKEVDDEEGGESEGFVVDRNELLRRLIEDSKK